MLGVEKASKEVELFFTHRFPRNNFELKYTMTYEA